MSDMQWAINRIEELEASVRWYHGERNRLLAENERLRGAVQDERRRANDAETRARQLSASLRAAV